MKSLVVALALLLAAAAAAQDYPSRPVKIVVSYAPGGSNDVVARMIAPELQKELGQSFIVENRAGASGTIGADMVAKAAPDGYTLFMGAGAHALAPSLFKKLPYDITKDFAPVSLAATSTYVLVLDPSVPATTVPRADRAARSPSRAAQLRLCGKGHPVPSRGRAFKSMTGTDIVHVPYGSARRR